jgi:hypothetical protein
MRNREGKNHPLSRRPRPASRRKAHSAPIERSRNQSADLAALDAELTEALEATFPGSDPVSLESPLVSGSPRTTAK